MFRIHFQLRKLCQISTLTIFYRTTFSEFAAKHAKDSRFKAIEKMKDREALFNEFITAARKKEKEDSKTRGEKVRFSYEDHKNSMNERDSC